MFVTLLLSPRLSVNLFCIDFYHSFRPHSVNSLRSALTSLHKVNKTRVEFHTPIFVDLSPLYSLASMC